MIIKIDPQQSFLLVVIVSKFHLENLFKQLTQQGSKQVTFGQLLTLDEQKQGRRHGLSISVVW